jgi:zinc/manganese transport system ATP-binding protein
LPSSLRQQIAYLPQNFLFDRRIPITVTELVGLGWDKLGWQLPWADHRQRGLAIREALARVDAAHLRHQLIGGLSGGETKRVLLAYCLVRPRRLLILDEAPAGLDLRGESDFYQLLYQLKREQGWAILQISHDLDMVRRQCDRVLCLNRSLLCQGPPEVALLPDNLSATYGSEFVRYHHRCQHQH